MKNKLPIIPLCHKCKYALMQPLKGGGLSKRVMVGCAAMIATNWERMEKLDSSQHHKFCPITKNLKNERKLFVCSKVFSRLDCLACKMGRPHGHDAFAGDGCRIYSGMTHCNIIREDVRCKQIKKLKKEKRGAK